MARMLYDLAGAEPERRFSPYCWRIRLALAHKGLDVETVPWRFAEKAAIAFSGQGLVPVLVDGETVVSDSWRIATYLEEAYPDRPSLFGGPAGMALTRFVANWADAVVNAGLARLIVSDIPAHLDPGDLDYFVSSREKRFGMKLDAVTAGREERVAEFRQALHPLRMTLRTQPYIGGEAPDYADYAVFGGFQWARCVSRFPVLEADDPVAAWRGRLLDAFGGLARRAPGYDG
ncbi:glutathione S-transferase family protein [Roseomonas sp. NAR14]|uniref:Glutathione S-transferase family protein n=1 Tax=Roseomonas acroporae TaxID=2937791 RepID=A0A9X1YC06_9PROT|nr:glutathione S-transferase family protein [Roseomonas acroporae]MCK8786215.1 glutathione S-transferase family protein [Roseomonas acroporae]